MPSPWSRYSAAIALLTLSTAAQAPKEVRFEVLSIRPANGPGAMSTAPSPNGFDSRLSLWQAINVAYGPTNFVNWGSVQIRNAPDWTGQFYDFKGRVSAADLKAWQSQGPDHELLRSAMRAALRDRCRLAIHEEPAKAEIFELVVGKRAPQLKAASTPPPAGIKLPTGGILVQTVENGAQVKTYYNATMQDLCDFLAIMSSHIPVRDKTGLSGRYDFRIRQTPPQPDENHVYSYSVAHLGLQVKRGVESRPALVIDHIEKPTAN